MFDKLMDLLRPVAEIATAYTAGTPAGAAVAAVAAALSIIDKATDDDTTDKERTQMYADLAERLGKVSSTLILALSDGEVTDEEHRQILTDLQKITQ